MEVEIEKIVKAWKKAPSAAEIADREEEIAHIKESMSTSSTASYELCETLPKVQCSHCLLYWNQGIVHST